MNSFCSHSLLAVLPLLHERPSQLDEEYFFPTEGDLVCFPSWLVHNVPSHWESETRVAFAANLQGLGLCKA